MTKEELETAVKNEFEPKYRIIVTSLGKLDSDKVVDENGDFIGTAFKNRVALVTKPKDDIGTEIAWVNISNDESNNFDIGLDSEKETEIGDKLLATVMPYIKTPLEER